MTPMLRFLVPCSLVFLAGWQSSSVLGQTGDESWIQPLSPRPESVSYINEPQVTIRFRIAPGSTPPSDVELWYTQDGAMTWSLWTGPKETKPGLIRFEAWKDGLYGFYVILKNRYGGSAPPPRPGTAPHQWVRVDQTAPVAQLLEARPGEGFAENREVLVRWNTRDDCLPERGTSLYFRTELNKTFQKIADGLEPSSSFRWTVPDDVQGIVTLKVSSIDRAGNRGSDVSRALRIDGGSRVTDSTPATPPDAPLTEPPTPEPQPAATTVDTTPKDTTSPVKESGEPPASDAPTPVTPGSNEPVKSPVEPTATPPGAKPPASRTIERETPDGPALIAIPGVTDPPALRREVSEAASREAKKRYDLGTWHRLRGESATAMVKYREALEMNPDLADARCDLAGLLFLSGRHEAAEKEFERVLKAEPRHRAALKSLALVQAAQRKYRSAQATLQKLLLIDENDSEAWLYLGDVTMFLKDGVAARELWNKALALKEVPAEVRERAQKRLAIYRSEQRSLAVAGEAE